MKFLLPVLITFFCISCTHTYKSKERNVASISSLGERELDEGSLIRKVGIVYSLKKHLDEALADSQIIKEGGREYNFYDCGIHYSTEGFPVLSIPNDQSQMVTNKAKRVLFNIHNDTLPGTLELPTRMNFRVHKKGQLDGRVINILSFHELYLDDSEFRTKKFNIIRPTFRRSAGTHWKGESSPPGDLTIFGTDYDVLGSIVFKKLNGKWELVEVAHPDYSQCNNPDL